MMSSKMILNTISASAAVFLLQGCSSSSGGEDDKVLGTKCDPSDLGVCGQGQEGGSDYTCETDPNTSDNICSLSCTGASDTSCADAKDGYTCQEDGDGDFYCFPDPSPPPTGTQLGDDCNPTFRGTCGQGQQGGSDFECIEDEANVSYCTTKCIENNQPLMGACELGEAGPSDFFCNTKSGYCERTANQSTPAGTKLGDSCDPTMTAGVCGAGEEGDMGFVCKMADGWKFVCTEECTQGALGACDQGTLGEPGYSCKKEFFGDDYYCFK